MRPRFLTRAVILCALGAHLAAAAPAAAQSSPGAAPGAAKAGAGATASGPGAGAASTKAGASSAGSKPGAPPTAAELDALYKQAVRAMNAGKYQTAYENFKIVWEVDGTPTTAGNLGTAELHLKKYRDAAEHLEIFLRKEKDLDPEERKEAEGELAQAKARVITLRVEVPAPGTEIRIDGKTVATSPVDHDLYLDPGPHLILVLQGEATAQVEIEDVAGGVQKVRLEPKAPVKPPPPPPPPPPEKPFPARTVVLVGGAVLVVAGAVLLGVAVDQKAQAIATVPTGADGRPLCAHDADLETGSSTDCNRVRSLAGTADTLWGAGMGVLITGSVVAASAALPIWSRSSKSGEPTSSRVVPVVGPAGGGLVWQGTF